ncbi:uncharacterized protein TNCV_4233771 [Trichonephila clavipes]|nr:uncharacterized protein TNCV_4233771 [Trichonephila clavipes]
MEVTRVEQCAYIKIVVLRGKNAMEYHSELVEALGNNALPYRTVARWHSPYSPDISPCDFDLIPKIKEPILGRQFATREDIANAVRRHLTQFTHDAANGEPDDIQCLPHRWQRVVTVAEDYIEGL